MTDWWWKGLLTTVIDFYITGFQKGVARGHFPVTPTYRAVIIPRFRAAVVG
ncbi:hypothetical protein SBA4_5280001 [Candidatus Sulfopaludibacter sp. SbA4]|nr:hypothetical protein SBA4_5280001 [Candidatus Sulfopaludibacter sp. SbA4]